METHPYAYTRKRRRLLHALLSGAALAASLSLVKTATADSTPIGPPPKRPTTTVIANHGSLLAVALPRHRPSTGLVWRLARPVDPTILRQISEADVGPSVVIVFRAISSGTTRVVFALTHGENGSTALLTTTYAVRIT